MTIIRQWFQIEHSIVSQLFLEELSPDTLLHFSKILSIVLRRSQEQEAKWHKNARSVTQLHSH